jgi:hypothetical protein
MSIVYKCKKCIKEYSTYKSLWRHDALKHKLESQSKVSISKSEGKSESKSESKSEEILIEYKNYKCSYCNNKYKHKQSKYKHEKKCINNSILVKNNVKSKDEEIIKIKQEMEVQKKEVEALKNQLQKALKIHPKTLQKINNQLNNSGTINNVTIIQLGSEDLITALNSKEKRFILDRQAMSLNHLVDLVHVSKKYKKFHNVYITNLQSTFAYKFDVKQNKFIAVNKNELLTDIVDSRMYDIQKFYDEIYPELEPRKAEQIKKFIDRMGNEEDELKDIKKEEIKLILYNNLDKILVKDEIEL